MHSTLARDTFWLLSVFSAVTVAAEPVLLVEQAAVSGTSAVTVDGKRTIDHEVVTEISRG